MKDMDHGNVGRPKAFVSPTATPKGTVASPMRKHAGQNFAKGGPKPQRFTGKGPSPERFSGSKKMKTS